MVECGTWKGGSATNLSLICHHVGRRLRIYDSFEGLPNFPGDRQARFYEPGDFSRTLEEVRHNVARFGCVESCDFIKGWFADTLPSLDQPVLLAFLDVDLETSLEVCVRHIWANWVEQGYIFIDEFNSLEYCALFFSESYLREVFHRNPPGLLGAGLGLALGEFYIGPQEDRHSHPLQHANAAAYTRKDFTANWAVFSQEAKPKKHR